MLTLPRHAFITQNYWYSGKKIVARKTGLFYNRMNSEAEKMALRVISEVSTEASIMR